MTEFLMHPACTASCHHRGEISVKFWYIRIGAFKLSVDAVAVGTASISAADALLKSIRCLSRRVTLPFPCHTLPEVQFPDGRISPTVQLSIKQIV